MFEQRRFERRVDRAAKSLLAEIATAGRFTEEAHSCALVAASTLRPWPIDELTGGDYRFISGESVTAAVRGLAWWLIVFLESYAEPEKPGFDHQATADLLVPLRDDVRGRLLERNHPVSHERVLGVISTVLTGRHPDLWEGTVVTSASYALSTSMRQLVERLPRAAERLATGAPLVRERWPADVPHRPAQPAAPPPIQSESMLPAGSHPGPVEPALAHPEQPSHWSGAGSRQREPHPASPPAQSPVRPSAEPPDLTLPPVPQTRLRPSAGPPDLTLPPLPKRRRS